VGLRFYWDFWEKRLLGVVFLWTSCGGLSGKDGFWDVVFGVRDFLQGICGNLKNSFGWMFEEQATTTAAARAIDRSLRLRLSLRPSAEWWPLCGGL
jgi:hypothetical protein